MLPKAYLTSYSRMSGSRWVITPSWLSGSWISFLYSSSVYSCHLFLVSSASVRFIPFLSFIVPVFAWNIPLVALIFLKRSRVFLILLFSSISLHWSLRKASLSPLAILWNSAFKWKYLSFSSLPLASLLFSAICKASSDTGEGNGTPLHYSCLENPMDRGAWWAAVHGVAQTWTRLKQLSSLRQLFCLFPFVFLEDGLDHCLLHNVTNLWDHRIEIYPPRYLWWIFLCTWGYEFSFKFSGYIIPTCFQLIQDCPWFWKILGALVNFLL